MFHSWNFQDYITKQICSWKRNKIKKINKYSDWSSRTKLNTKRKKNHSFRTIFEVSYNLPSFFFLFLTLWFCIYGTILSFLMTLKSCQFYFVKLHFLIFLINIWACKNSFLNIDKFLLWWLVGPMHLLLVWLFLIS